MRALHITFKAFTATFKMPFINTGTAVASPVPFYSNIVGLISCCAGRYIEKDETLIGFKYNFKGKGKDLETTKRLMLDTKGNLKGNPERGIVSREFHVNPQLDIYLNNLALKKYFEKPVGIPVLGRSQDISWITGVEEIDMVDTQMGKIKPTLIPFPCETIGGRVIRLCDYFINDKSGYLREADKIILYQIVPDSEEGIFIQRDNLYRINDSDEVIYMHKLGDER